MVKNIVDQLRRDEGEVLHVYDDATGRPIVKGSHVQGHPTIGIGRMIDHSRGGGITREESSYLLQNDINKTTDELSRRLPWFKDLNPARQGALQNMAHHMGVTGLLRFTTTLGLMAKGLFPEAAAQAMKSDWGRRFPTRAGRVTKQIETGEWQ